MTAHSVLVPDIGDFQDIPVIEILVKVGDVIVKEQALVSLESDKATMEVPSEVSGKVLAISVQVGDKVRLGTPLLTVELAEEKNQVPTPSLPTGQAPVVTSGSVITPPTTAASPISLTAISGTQTYQGPVDQRCQLLVLGSGPGGYSAAFRGADLGLETIIVERYQTLGGVCLNVGCIPSKALLHTAAVMEEVKSMAQHGVSFGAPHIDIDALRQHKEHIIGQLTTGLVGMAKARKVKVARGLGSFLDEHHLQLEETAGSGSELTGKKEVIYFEKVIIAAGSQPVKLPFLPLDPRIVDSTGALQLKAIPQKMLVIGGGIIGLEMATIYSALGARIDIVELSQTLMAGADRDLVKVWEKHNMPRFAQVLLGTKATAAQAKEDGIWVQLEGPKAPQELQRYDLVLVAVGRVPNGKKIQANAAGVQVDERGFIAVNQQMRTNKEHVFAIGDIIGQPMLAHKAVHEGHVAAEVAAGQKSFFDAKQIPSVAYTDPEVAWAGVTEEQCRAQGIAYQKGVFPWAASGRAIANGRSEGFTKLIFDQETHRIIGGGIVGTNAGDLIGEVCLAIEMGADQLDIAKTIHPHPTLGESIGLAAEVAHGSCTDLPPQRKK